MKTLASYAMKASAAAAEEASGAAQLNRRAVLGAAMAATLLTPIVGQIPRAAAAGLQVNPSNETIRLGPLGVRFLIDLPIFFGPFLR